MKVGDLKGAFVVTAPLTGLTAAAQSNSMALLIINLGVLLAAMGVVIFVVRQHVVKPVSASAALAQEIANNNLDVPDINVTSMDEVGQAVLVLNRMKNNLIKVVTAIAGTAEQLASASEEISAGAGQTAESARTQADQAQQVASAMQQMSTTVQQVSEQSHKASEGAKQAAGAARDGGKVAEQTLANMRAIDESTKNVAGRIGELGKGSEEIGKIVGVINDIADQTNLLALNAAIEAARAGEQGRGFAVVADEVRKLAERTTKSTGEIAAMIDSIQAETKNAVLAMEMGGRDVQSGVQKTQASGEALLRIIALSEKVDAMIAQIATAATEQSATTEQVTANVAQISSSTQEASSAAEQTAKACTDLSDMAFGLQRLVSQFKLDPASHHSEVQSSRVKGESKVKAAATAAGSSK